MSDPSSRLGRDPVLWGLGRQGYGRATVGNSMLHAGMGDGPMALEDSGVSDAAGADRFAVCRRAPVFRSSTSLPRRLPHMPAAEHSMFTARRSSIESRLPSPQQPYGWRSDKLGKVDRPRGKRTTPQFGRPQGNANFKALASPDMGRFRRRRSQRGRLSKCG